MAKKRNILFSGILTPDEIIVVNTKGEESPFSVARIAKDLVLLGITKGPGFDLGRELLNDICVEGLTRVSTDSIRHWISERDPRVLRSVRRGTGICELLDFLKEVPPEMNFVWAVPFLERLNLAELSASEAQSLIFPFERVLRFPEKDEKKKIKKKRKETEEEKQKREYIKQIAKGIRIPGAPPPPPWGKSGLKYFKSKKELVKEYIEKTGRTYFYQQWAPEWSSGHNPISIPPKVKIECHQEFLVDVSCEKDVDSCSDTGFDEVLDSVKFKAAELALEVCLLHKDKCPIPSPTGTRLIAWDCCIPTRKVISISILVGFICVSS